VLGAQPLAQQPARVTAVGVDWLTMRVPRAGNYTVRVRFTPYWALAHGSGCVAPAAGEWTEIRARAPGSYHLVIRFAIGRIFERGSRCT
jgi:hypothetical protein